jgi:hypothetical protein
VTAFTATYGRAALATPAVAVQVAGAGWRPARWRPLATPCAWPRRSRRACAAACPPPISTGKAPGSTIARRPAAGAQGLRWASFQRTLDPGRAKAYVGRFGDFDAVDAEARVFAYAAGHVDVEKA